MTNKNGVKTFVHYLSALAGGAYGRGQSGSISFNEGLLSGEAPNTYSGHGWRNPDQSLSIKFIGEADQIFPVGSHAIHHFASNKHSYYTSLFEGIASKYSLGLNGSWNKAPISTIYHYSKHPSGYHEFVLRGMQAADAVAKGNKDIFLQLFEQNVKQPVLLNPSMLNKTGW